MPAPRRNIKQPPSSSQGVAQGVKTPEPKEEDDPPPIPPKPSHVMPHKQQTTPTSPPIQRSVSPRVPVMSSFPAPTSFPAVTSSVTVPTVVGTQRVGTQPVVTSEFLEQSVMYFA